MTTRACEWAANDDGAWETECGRVFEFTTDGPRANGFTYCPYCGGGLREAEAKERSDDV